MSILTDPTEDAFGKENEKHVSVQNKVYNGRVQKAYKRMSCITV